MRKSTGLRTACLSPGLADAFDGGTARIAVYGGTVPATGDAAITGTLYGTLTPSSDVFAAPASGQVAANAITQDSAADASGAPTFVVLYRTTDTALTSAAGANDRRLILTAGGTGSGMECEFSGLVSGQIVAGGPIQITSLVYTEGNP